MSEDKWYLVRHVISKRRIERVTLQDYSEGDRFGYPKDRWTGYEIGRDLFRDRDAAIAAAEKKRDKKIASLKRQIAKLEAMTFEVE